MFFSIIWLFEFSFILVPFFPVCPICGFCLFCLFLVIVNFYPTKNYFKIFRLSLLPNIFIWLFHYMKMSYHFFFENNTASCQEFKPFEKKWIKYNLAISFLKSSPSTALLHSPSSLPVCFSTNHVLSYLGRGVQERFQAFTEDNIKFLSKLHKSLTNFC